MSDLIINPDTFNPIIYYISNERYDKLSSLSCHFHPFPVIMFVTDIQGTCHYRIENKIHEIIKGSIILCNPGVYHEKIVEPDANITELHIAFDNITIKGLQPNIIVSNAPYAITHIGAFEDDFYKSYNEVLLEQCNRTLCYDLMLKSYAVKLIVIAFRCYYNSRIKPSYDMLFEKNDKKHIVDNLRNYLCENYSKNISFERIAGGLYLSPAYLSKIFKAETGETPISYLIKLRLNKAKELLEKGNFTIISAAKSVGYDDLYYFSKLFKKYTGMSPSNYIKNLNADHPRS